MGLDGRINIDVLFHDTDGTTSLKVVSLEDSTAYTSGKVAVVSGTVGTNHQSISTASYRDAAGQEVTFSRITRVAIQSSGREVRYLMSSSPEAVAAITAGNLAVSDISPVFPSLLNHRIRATSGTASYTLVLYGT